MAKKRQKFPRINLDELIDILKGCNKSIAEFTADFGDDLFKRAMQSSIQYFEFEAKKPDYARMRNILVKLNLSINDKYHIKDYDYIQKWRYQRVENAYKYYYMLDSKHIFKSLELDVSKKNFDKKGFYFTKFIYAVVFLTAMYNYKIIVENDKAEVRELDESELIRKPITYYLFYNRSKIQSAKIGVGKVEFANFGSTVKAEFYYSSTQHNSIKEKTYSVRYANGNFREYNKNIITITLQDIELGNDRDKLGEFVSNHFVVKRYGDDNENILLGINNSWNRDHGFPFATALVLIKKEYYEKEYENNPNFAFDRIITERNNLNIPREVFYYIFRQILSLEQSLSKHINKKLEACSFNSMKELPYYSGEGEFIQKLAGRYKGISIINNGSSDILIISELEIVENGEVSLKVESIDRDRFDKGETKRDGCIKRIEKIKGTSVRVFITLRPGLDKHYNSLNYFLDSNDILENEDNRILLKGSFAGISIYSEMPTGSSILFQEQTKKEDISVRRIYLEEINKDEFSEFYLKERELVDMYLSRDNFFSNNTGFRLLENLVAVFKRTTNVLKNYDVFISLPLTHSDQESEYQNNCDLAIALRDEIIDKLKIPKKRIYCACLQENGSVDYNEYKLARYSKVPEFKRVRELIRTAKYFIGILPAGSTSGKISSALMEIGYAQGQKQDRNFICFYDKSVQMTLPDNLILLHPTKCLKLESSREESIREQFANNLEQIRDELGVD